jgi:hypothetical protein
MLYHDDVGEFVPGDPGTHFPHVMGPPGLVPLTTCVSDSFVPKSGVTSVRKWKRVRPALGGPTASVWGTDSDETMEDVRLTTKCIEELLIPDEIPEDVWQMYFRQGDSELNDKRETEFLLSLYKECSGRWPVIYDRWQSHGIYGPRGKSIESIKAKFNRAVTKLLEVDAISRSKKPSSDRSGHNRSLKYLPLFSMKYNEKNEYLRRMFLDNEYKRQKVSEASANADRYLGDLMRIPNMTVKMKKGQRSGQPSNLPPGPHLMSGLIQSVHSEISLSESNRVKAVVKGLGINRAEMMRTPQLAKLFAIVERETHMLLMMRDSVQRKKQELEIVKTSGTMGIGMSYRPKAPPSQAPSSNAQAAQVHKKKK